MVTCCFFGHKETPPGISDKLEEVLEKLILENSADYFLVGNQGGFDTIVLCVLRKLKGIYPWITYSIVLAYMPGRKEDWKPYDPMETLLPEGLESVHPRYAISWRNKWMIQEADVVVTYVTHSWGVAAQFAEMAKKQKKQVINIKDSADK